MSRQLRGLVLGALTSLALVLPVPVAHAQDVTSGTAQRATSSLKVVVKGLGNGVKAKVKVTGPGGFVATVAKTRTLTGLKKGDYKVVAKKVVLASGVVALPKKKTQKVTLGSSRRTVTVTYVRGATPEPPVPAAAGTNGLVVRGTGGAAPDGYLSMPSMSGDGRWVAFSSAAGNLGIGSPTEAQVYLKDRSTGTLHLVSKGLGGGPATGGWSATPTVSDDGRYVAFESAATDLTADVLPPGSYNVFLWDRVTAEVTMVSRGFDGGLPNGQSVEPDISADGRHVGFTSQASNLVDDELFGSDTNGLADVFSWDRTTGETVLVSRTPSGGFIEGGAVSATVSSTGRYIGYSSDSDDIVVGVTSPGTAQGVYVWDRTSGETTFAALGNIPSISADGNVVAFMEPYTGTPQDVRIWRRGTGTTEVVSQTPGDGAANGDSTLPVISADGGTVTFLSEASNLVAREDGSSSTDVFVWRAATDSTALVTQGRYGDAVGSEFMEPAISADGNRVAFISAAAALATVPIAADGDLFLWTRS